MATKARPQLIDKRILTAQSHPIRAHVLNILSEGPSSPAKMHRRMENVSLNLLCYHVRALRDVGLIELIEVRHHGGRREHIYRATQRQYFSAEEWLAIDSRYKNPLVTTILQQISEDTGRAAAEGRLLEYEDAHLSRSPIELDKEGWEEVVEVLASALGDVLEAHARSAERAQKSGEERIAARVVIMQYPIGREGRDKD